MSISQEIQRIKTNIANAYTQANEKGATLPEVQNSANLADTISSIQTGGGTPASVEEKDINFYDYDGTRLYSYTLAEIQELTELPELPSHDGLICQGWNWTLADIKNENKETDVGAMYITDDGKTRLYIDIATEGRMTVPLCFQQSVPNGVEVDWGDGSAVETFPGSGLINILPTHKYSAVGKYVITLNPASNCILTLGSNTSSYCIMGSSSNGNKIYCNMLYNVAVGRNVTSISSSAFSNCYSLSSITMPDGVTSIGNSAFYNCYSLSSITIPDSVTSIGNSAFNGCYSLSSITIPDSVTSIGSSAFRNCSNLTSITIPDGVTSIGNYAFNGCYLLSSITMPDGVTSIGDYAFSNCYSLSSITIPDSVTSIGDYAFSGCYSLSSITIPDGVTSIGSSAFWYCFGMKFYNFSAYTTIPTLGNRNTFNGIPSDCKIIVPDNLYEDWIVATNWSTYASYIIKKTDWEASQV